MKVHCNETIVFTTESKYQDVQEKQDCSCNKGKQMIGTVCFEEDI